MSEDSQAPPNKISTADPQNDLESDAEDPEIGVGLILLGISCLIFGIAIGLVFTVK